MFSRRWAPVVIAVALAAVLEWGGTARPQNPTGQQTPGVPTEQAPGQPPPIIDGGRPSDQDSVITRRMLAKQAEMRNKARQEQLVQDTNRLFELAKELKDQVAKTNQDVLSVDVVKKAAEIEKLAKSVRDKMKAD